MNLWELGSAVGVVTRLEARTTWEMFDFACRPTPGPTRPGREVDQWPPAGVEDKNSWSYTATPLYFFMVWTGTRYVVPYIFDALLILIEGFMLLLSAPLISIFRIQQWTSRFQVPAVQHCRHWGTSRQFWVHPTNFFKVSNSQFPHPPVELAACSWCLIYL